jgi:acyl-coenzyme A synthetase/AMP-(fatty) acid ligase
MTLQSALFECPLDHVVIELYDDKKIFAGSLISRIVHDIDLLNAQPNIEIGSEANFENLYRCILAIFSGAKAIILKQDSFKTSKDLNTKKIVDESISYLNSYQEFNLDELQEAHKDFKNKIFNDINSFEITLTTSGSSGLPKSVVLDDKSLDYQSSEVSKLLNFDINTRQLLYMPINYIYGLSIITTWLKSGSCIILPKNNIQNPNMFFNELILRQITVFSGVPYTFNMMCKWELQKLNDSSITAITQAGGRLRLENKRKIVNNLRNIDFWVMYGQTEFGGRISQYKLSTKEIDIDELCVGYPLNGIKVFIEKDKECDGLGEIFIQSPSMAKNINSLDEIRNIKGNNFYSTGDIGRYENDLLYVSDRNKNFIKIGGSRVSTAAVSKSLTKLPGIQECFLCLGNKKNEKILIGLHTELFKDINSQWEVSEKIDEVLGKDILSTILDCKPYEIFLLHGELPLLENSKLWVWKIHEKIKGASIEKKSVHIWL